MPTLFLSYKRGVPAVAGVKNYLREQKYGVWFDIEDIQLGETDWDAAIERGVRDSAGVILCLTPAACDSPAIHREVEFALKHEKTIFPIVLEKLNDISANLQKLGLPPRQQVADFTAVELWEANCQKLLDALVAHGIVVSRHNRSRSQDADEARLREYLSEVISGLGRVSLPASYPWQEKRVPLERLYVTPLTAHYLSIEVQQWHIVDWWFSANRENAGVSSASRPKELGKFSLEQGVIEGIIDHLQQQIEKYRELNPSLKADEPSALQNRWNNGIKENIYQLSMHDVAAVCSRLVVLGEPGSGKSTFVRYLALCLAGAKIEQRSRPLGLENLGEWTHGKLTPVYVHMRDFVMSAQFPKSLNRDPDSDDFWNYLEQTLPKADLARDIQDLKSDLSDGSVVLILDGLSEVAHETRPVDVKRRQEQMRALLVSITDRYPDIRIIVTSRAHPYVDWRLPAFFADEIIPFDDNQRYALFANLHRNTTETVKDLPDATRHLLSVLRDLAPELT